jgi:hypothetical protein
MQNMSEYLAYLYMSIPSSTGSIVITMKLEGKEISQKRLEDLFQWVPGGVSPGVKQVVREAASSAKIKNSGTLPPFPQ